MSELKGKIVLITGASKGIGAAAFKSAISAGADVILHYNRSNNAAMRLAEEAGPERCMPVSADISKPEEITRLWNNSLEWRGKINVLVNNAAIYEYADIDWPVEQWHDSWART